MKSTRKGFTLVEIMVVLVIISVLMAAFTSSVAGARKRANISKATSEVKVVSQAILAYEQFGKDMPSCKDADADENSLGFLIGEGGSADSGGKIPPLLMASLRSGGKMLDPWNTPYKISIKAGETLKFAKTMSNVKTGYFLPNFYRLSEEERK